MQIKRRVDIIDQKNNYIELDELMITMNKFVKWCLVLCMIISQAGCNTMLLQSTAREKRHRVKLNKWEQAFINNNTLTVIGKNKNTIISAFYSINIDHGVWVGKNPVKVSLLSPYNTRTGRPSSPPQGDAIPIKNVEIPESELKDICFNRTFEKIDPSNTNAAIYTLPKSITSYYNNLAGATSGWCLYTDGIEYFVLRPPSCTVTTQKYRKLLLLFMPVTIAVDIVTFPIQAIACVVIVYTGDWESFAN